MDACYLLFSNLLMQVQQSNFEELKANLKNQFAKSYKIRAGKSLIQVKEKSKIHKKHNSSLNEQTTKTHSSNLSHLNKSELLTNKPKLNETLRQLNFSHHTQQSCLCGNCLCGRHLCKLEVIKPDLKKNSTYQKSFLPKKAMKAQKVIAQQTSPLQGNHLDFSTEYIKNYEVRAKDKIQRPHPQDSLKFQGPPQELTTYGHFFPGYRGPNQYIKPTNKHWRGDFPLFGKSTYNTEFLAKHQKRDQDLKVPDHLKTGSNWLGQTTYGNAFKNHNPEEIVGLGNNFKQFQKYQKNPDFTRQFETNYKKQYIQKQSPICPSKIQLQSGMSSQFNQSKHLFRQNTDYRSMSPEFKAIATSKHFYV